MAALFADILESMNKSYRKAARMATSVKKTISLPSTLANEAEQTARLEGKSLSAVIQDALRVSRAVRQATEFRRVQGFWAAKAKEKGLLTEGDLERFLRK